MVDIWGKCQKALRCMHVSMDFHIRLDSSPAMFLRKVQSARKK